MKRSICVLLGSTPLWLAGGAFAQATPDGAAALRDGLTEMLQPILSAEVQGKPLFQGPITVEPAGADYEVVFPATDLTVTPSPQGAPQTVTAHCDAQTYRAIATGTAGYRLETEAPMRCLAEASGKPPVTLTSRAFRAHSVVDLEQKLFTETGWEADGITIGQDGKPAMMTIDRLTGVGALQPATDPARHDAAFRIEAAGMSGGDPAGPDLFTLGRAVYDGRMDGADVRLILAGYGELIGVYAELFQSAAAPDRKPSDPLPPETMRKFFAACERMMAASGDAGEATVTLADLRVKAPEIQVTLDTLRYGGVFAGVSGPVGGGTLNLEMAGLALAPKPPFAQWIPADATITLEAHEIPWQEVATAYASLIATALDQAPAEAERAMAAMAELGGVLRRAGSRLDVKTFHIAAPEAAIDLGGSVTGDSAAAHGVTADLDLRFTNLDGLLKFLQTLPDGQEAAAGMTMVQVLGRQAETDDGTSARDYDIVVDAGGKILVNGTDLSALAPKLP